VVLAPHGQTYYLPTPKLSSRPPSPSPGYNSDPESAYRNVRGVGELILPASSRGFADTKGDASIAARKRRSHRRNGNAAHQSGENPKTAGWQDLLKYAMVPFEVFDTTLITSVQIGHSPVSYTRHGGVSVKCRSGNR
jgi:hypothetical protein